MTSIKTIKYAREVVNHPYALMKILPFVGDFADQAQNVNKSLYREDVIDKEEFDYITGLILSVERNGDEVSFKKLMKILNKCAGWEE